MVGKTIADVEVLQPKCLNVPPGQFKQALTSAAVREVTYRGEWVPMDTTGGWLLLSPVMGGEMLLGWEWEMGLNGLMADEAKGRGVKLLMLHIPREVMEPQAIEKGDIRFFELAYLEADVRVKGRTVTVKLTDFVIPNTELIPQEVRQKVRKWSDYVDYWAVDWDFRNDTFINQWTSYRTRRDRSLKLLTDPHTYDQPGTYNVLVKVIDIFGIDTSQLFEVTIAP